MRKCETCTESVRLESVPAVPVGTIKLERAKAVKASYPFT